MFIYCTLNGRDDLALPKNSRELRWEALGFPGRQEKLPKIEVPKALCFTMFELATTNFAAERRR